MDEMKIVQLDLRRTVVVTVPGSGVYGADEFETRGIRAVNMEDGTFTILEAYRRFDDGSSCFVAVRQDNIAFECGLRARRSIAMKDLRYPERVELVALYGAASPADLLTEEEYDAEMAEGADEPEIPQDDDE